LRLREPQRIPFLKTIVDSRQLNAFAALARSGSFTLAAKRLSVTQSAVSHAIKALEEDLSCRLVDRVGKRIQLTASGKQLLVHAENILREMQAARAGIEAASTSDGGGIRVGAGTTACQYLLPSVIREFQSGYPHCSIALEPGGQSRLFELLRGGHVDLALVLSPAPGALDDLILVPLFEDELRLLVSPQHPWAKLAGGPGQELEEGTLILCGRRGHSHGLVADYFRQERAAMGSVIELGSVDAVKEMAKLGIGAAVLPPWSASAELASGSLVSIPLGRRTLRRQWNVAYWKGRRLNPIQQAFVGLCGTSAKVLEASAFAAVG